VRQSSCLAVWLSLYLSVNHGCGAVQRERKASRCNLWRLTARTFLAAIIGVLPGASGSFTKEEQEGMMDTMRSATRNTMFERWLDATTLGGGAEVLRPPEPQVPLPKLPRRRLCVIAHLQWMDTSGRQLPDKQVYPADVLRLFGVEKRCVEWGPMHGSGGMSV
jgi:hypothetical protein